MNCIVCNKLHLFKHTFSLGNNRKFWWCESIGIFRDIQAMSIKHYKDDLIKILDLHVKDSTRRRGSYFGRHH